MRVNVLFVLSYLIGGLSLLAEEAQPGAAKEVLVNRRVFILDFYNLKKSKEYEYLEVSIPEALVEPLNDTGKFEVLNRSTWNKLSGVSKYSKADLFDEEKAAALGAAADADVVVIGKFIVQGKTLQIQIKAVEVSSKRAMVSRTDNALTDSSMFTTITALSNKVSTDMAKRLPPLPQRVIYQDRIKSKEQAEEVKAQPQPEEKKGPMPSERVSSPNWIVLRAGYFFANIPKSSSPLNTQTTLYTTDSYPSFSFEAEYRRLGLFLHPRFAVFARAGFTYAGSRNIPVENEVATAIINSNTYYGTIGVGQQIILGGNFFILPALGAGYAYQKGTLWHPANTFYIRNISFYNPTISGILNFGYLINNRIGLEVYVDWTVYLFQSYVSSALSGGIGLGYKF